MAKSPMTCRIDRVLTEKDPVVLRVSGWIRRQDLDILRAALEHESGAVAIDLKEVGLLDRDAVKLLAFSEGNGVELRNCPAYIREWVEGERAQTKSDQSAQRE
jgi:hypothetical protein